jgi:AFG3 family protein
MPGDQPRAATAQSAESPNHLLKVIGRPAEHFPGGGQTVPSDSLLTRNDGAAGGASGEQKSLAETLAALTPGFVGADIANVCNEAALIAARESAPFVRLAHFDAAIERVIAGIRRTSTVLGPKERRTVAIHEAGHAVAGWFLPLAEPLLKVSIVPRGAAALGFAQYLPSEQHLWSVAELADRMAMMLAGRVAEALFFGPDAVTTGARDDIEKVTRLAYAQVASYGMSPRLGAMSYRNPSPGPEDDTIGGGRTHSEETARIIDAEARSLVDAAMSRANEVISVHRDLVQRVADSLVTREALTRSDIEAILGPRPVPE